MQFDCDIVAFMYYAQNQASGKSESLSTTHQAYMGKCINHCGFNSNVFKVYINFCKIYIVLI